VTGEQFLPAARRFFPWDVAPDGPLLPNTVKEYPAANTSSITLVLNWTTELQNSPIG